MDTIIEFVAKYFLFLSVLIVALFWLRAQRATKVDLAWQLLAGGVVALALATLAGHLYYDTRPFVSQHIRPLIAHAADNGFPSDHALLTSFLGFTLLLYSRAVGSTLLGIAVLVGAARVAAHIHTPVDIIGSFVLAAFAVLFVRVVSNWWKGRRAEFPLH